MADNFEKRKSPGISLKTSMISGIIVLVLLSGISFVLLHLEAGLVKYILDRHLAKTERTIERYGNRQKASLENKIDTNADISSEVLSLPLFGMDQDWLKRAVKPYMKIVEVQAIEILNENGDPFVAVWREKGVETGSELPVHIRDQLGEYVERASFYENIFVGTITLYFSRKIMENDLALSKKKAESEAEMFLSVVNLEVGKTKRIQIVAVLFVVVALVLTISFYLQAVVIKPVLKCVEFAQKISTGIFSARLDYKSNDEIGQLAFALDDMAESIMIGQTELKNALDHTKRASRQKSEFHANMSHELRTPLNSILLIAKMLAENREKNLLDKQVKLMEMICNSGSELLEMINELLDLAKVEAGMMAVMKDKVFLRDIRDYYYRSFENMALEKSIEFDISIEDGLPEFIITDSQRLNQIIRNLLSNAFKFTDNGHVSLRISRPDNVVNGFKKVRNKDRTIGFVVADTGIGIPEEKLEAIFESFTQVDGSISRKYGGTGLGLSISKEFSHLLGGEVHVRSKEGDGSAFTLYLPFTPGEEKNVPFVEGPIEEQAAHGDSSENIPLEGPQGGRSGSTDGENVRIGDEVICVRDDRHISTREDKSVLIAGCVRGYAKNIPEFFRERGYYVIVTELIETSIFLANYYKPDLILIDANLPDETGWNAVKRLSTYHGTSHIPLFFGFPASCEEENRFHVRYRFGVDENDSVEDKNRMSCLGQGAVVLQNKNSALGKRVEGIKKYDGVEDAEAAVNLLKSSVYEWVLIEKTPSSKNEIGFLSFFKETLPGQDISVQILCTSAKKNKEIVSAQFYPKDVSDEERMKLDGFFSDVSMFIDDFEAREGEPDEIQCVEEEYDKEFANKKILIVEDDMRSLYSLKSILEEVSANVIPAVSGEKGLERLEENPDMDIVLMDMIMPGMDGYQAIREIRKQKRFFNLPVIAVTANALPGDCKKCIEAGATDYLAKPIDSDKLFPMISIWLEKF